MNIALAKQVGWGALKFHETGNTLLGFECFQNNKPLCHDMY